MAFLTVRYASAFVLALCAFGCGGQTGDPLAGIGSPGASGSSGQGGSGTSEGGSTSVGAGGASAGKGGSNGGAAGQAQGGIASGGHTEGPGGGGFGSSVGAGGFSGSQPAGGHATGGTQAAGGQATGGQSVGGQAAGGANTGGAGGGSNCCVADSDCGDFVGGECVSGVCKPLLDSGACWRDADCFQGGACEGVEVCGCDVNCNGTGDHPGTCVSSMGGGGSNGTGGSSSGCCGSSSDCNVGDECVSGVCKPHVNGGCWSQLDCDFPGPGNFICEGASVCPCGDDCDIADMVGMCVLQQPAGPCPTTTPADGAACTNEGQSCQYGDDIRANDCRTTATCNGGAWSVPVGLCAPLDGPGQNGCPNDPKKGNGLTCSTQGQLCDEGKGGICACGVCEGLCGGGTGGGPGGFTWTCVEAPNGGCPDVAPDVGQACNSGNLQCNYGLCSTESHAGRVCSGGVWASEDAPCPL